MIGVNPKEICDVYAICGPSTICNAYGITHCNCMEGFSATSSEDWELDDRTSGCSRNTQLDCIRTKSTTRTTDKFYPVPCVSLPQNPTEVKPYYTSSMLCKRCRWCMFLSLEVLTSFRRTWQGITVTYTVVTHKTGRGAAVGMQKLELWCICEDVGCHAAHHGAYMAC